MIAPGINSSPPKMPNSISLNDQTDVFGLSRPMQQAILCGHAANQQVDHNDCQTAGAYTTTTTNHRKN
jgi:hypothetical protein